MEGPREPLNRSDDAVLARIKEHLAAHGDVTSRFDRKKGNLFVFRVDGERTCPYGARHRGSNNFAVLLTGTRLEYVCNSSECSARRPRAVIGELTIRDRMVGATVEAVHPIHDKSVYEKLEKSLVDYWAFQGDRGGSRIFTHMYPCLRQVVLHPHRFPPVAGSLCATCLSSVGRCFATGHFCPPSTVLV
jgi:hypothetical protein